MSPSLSSTATLGTALACGSLTWASPPSRRHPCRPSSSRRSSHPDGLERRHHGRPDNERLRREQGSSAQPRADLGGGPEGHRHPGKRAVARADGDRAREGSARRGGPELYASMTLLQRMADPAEIGAAAAFLASDDSSFMTASELAVDRSEEHTSEIQSLTISYAG